MPSKNVSKDLDQELCLDLKDREKMKLTHRRIWSDPTSKIRTNQKSRKPKLKNDEPQEPRHDQRDREDAQPSPCYKQISTKLEKTDELERIRSKLVPPKDVKTRNLYEPEDKHQKNLPTKPYGQDHEQEMMAKIETQKERCKMTKTDTSLVYLEETRSTD